MHKGRLRVLNPAGEGAGERSAAHPEEGDSVVPEGLAVVGDRRETLRGAGAGPRSQGAWRFGAPVCAHVRLGYGQRESGTMTGGVRGLAAA